MITSVTEHLDAHIAEPFSRYTVDQLQQRVLELESLVTQLLEKLDLAVARIVTDSGHRLAVVDDISPKCK